MVKEENNKIAKEINEQMTINSVEEGEIIKNIEEKTKLDKDKIKKAITFRKKEPEKGGEENIEEDRFTQLMPLGYQKINGSIILTLG